MSVAPKYKQLVSHIFIIHNEIGFAIISHTFSEDREKYIGMAEALAAIGLMIGPVMGGFLYTSFGYFYSFLAFGVILLINCLITVFATPSSVNNQIEERNDDDEESGNRQHTPIKEITF